jgi:hypothetical protein
MLKETEAAASALELQLQVVQAAGPDDLDDPFLAMIRARADAVILLPGPMLLASTNAS